ncbi:MAG: putative zinc-binding protein [Bacteroidales bacterium]|nr:putative zinc-binding protein [Bacteroidales bacterium]
MENNQKPTCGCGVEGYIVLACSGASDLGYISDQVARKLSRNKVRKMNCLTVAATGTEEKIEEFKKSNILVIDGCSEDCGKKIMAMRGITDYSYLRLTDMGYEKGKTPISQDTIKDIYNKAEIIY